MPRNRPQLDLTADQEATLRQAAEHFEQLYYQGGEIGIAMVPKDRRGLIYNSDSLPDQVAMTTERVAGVMCEASGLRLEDLSRVTLNVAPSNSGKFYHSAELQQLPHSDGVPLLLTVLSTNPNTPGTAVYPGAHKALGRSRLHTLFSGGDLSADQKRRLEAMVRAESIQRFETRPGDVIALTKSTIHHRIMHPDNHPAMSHIRTRVIAEVRRNSLRYLRFLSRHATP